MKPLELSPADMRLLEAFSRYRLLTIPQCLTLQIANRKHLGERLGRLVKQGYLAFLPEFMRFPRVYWMTDKVARHYGEALGDACARNVVSAKGRAESAHLRQHVTTVDVHIALRRWAEANSITIEWFRGSQEGGKPTRLERGKTILEPDGLAVIRLADGTPHLLAIEVETGGFSENVQHFAAQLPARLDAKHGRFIELALGWPEAEFSSRLLFVFKSHAMFGSALKVMAGATLPKGVAFAALPDLVQGFGNCWHDVHGDQTDPFPSSL